MALYSKREIRKRRRNDLGIDGITIKEEASNTDIKPSADYFPLLLNAR